MCKYVVFSMRLVSKFTVAALLAGCVATAPRDGAVTTAAQAAEPPAAPPVPKVAPLPNVALTPELLYQLLIAEITAQRGGMGAASVDYLNLARSTRDPRLAERAAQIAVFSGDTQKALAALRLWVELDPENLDARQGLVVFLLRNDQGDAALEHLEKLLAAAPAPSPAKSPADANSGLEFNTPQGHGFMFIAALLGREQNKAAALRLMGKFAAAHKDNPDALFAYGNLAMTHGDLGAARTAVEQALQHKPDWANAVALRARILQLQGDSSAALAYLGDAVKNRPQDMMLRLGYARLLVEAQRTDEARAQFAAMAEQMADNADVLFSIALLSMQIKQPDDAVNYLKQVIKLDKFTAESHYYLGQIAENKKQYREAIDFYKIVDRGDAYLDAQLRIVGLLARQDDVAAARAHLRTIQARDPQQAKLITMAEADLLREEKQYTAAMEVYNNALSEQPKDNLLLYGRAMLAEKMDRLDILEQDLRSILEREPDNARALNALGYTLADRTTRYEEALALIKRALELNPQDAATLDSMGWVQYRLGHNKEALDYLQKAYALDPNAEIAAHLGEVLWVSGDREGARKIWQEALHADPKDEILLGTVKRFDNSSPGL